MTCKVCEEIKHILDNKKRYKENELVKLIEERLSHDM